MRLDFAEEKSLIPVGRDPDFNDLLYFKLTCEQANQFLAKGADR